MSNAEEKIKKFVRRCMSPKSGYTRLSLIQLMSSGGTNTLQNVDIAQGQYVDEEKVSEIAAEFLSNAQEDADGHIGVSSYCVKSFKGVTLGERSPMFRLRSQELDSEDNLGETEPATKDGHLAQLMRHNEALMRGFTQMSEVLANQSTSVIARQNDQIKHYDERHFETIIELEKLLTDRHTRELDSARAIASEKRKTEIMGTMKPLIPILMAKFKGTPESAKPGLFLESLKAIMSDVTPEKMAQIANILGPKSIALAEIYIEAQEAKEKSDEQQAGSAEH